MYSQLIAAGVEPAVELRLAEQLRRAGLDYHEYASLQVHDDLETALAAISPPRLFALSTRNSLRFDAPR